jgi:hypothetical protein
MRCTNIMIVVSLLVFPAAALGQEADRVARAHMLPGPPHEALRQLSGTWTAKAEPKVGDAPVEESEATAKISMMLDGRFMREEYKGVMMGMPFTSYKLLGYNNGSNKYEGVWTYTLGTNMMTLSGTSEDGGSTITCDSTFDNEMGVGETVTITYKIVDPDHFTVTMGGAEMPDGSAGSEMEIVYTRQ